MCGALQASRNGGNMRMAGGKDGSGDGEVEGTRIKSDNADVGARRGGGDRRKKSWTTMMQMQGAATLETHRS